MKPAIIIVRKFLGGKIYMNRNYTSKLVFWLGWSVVWILTCKILAFAGYVAEPTLFQLLVECFLSILAVEIMCYHIPLRIILIALVTIKMLLNWGFVSVIIYILNLVLYVITKRLTKKKTKRKSPTIE